MWQFENYFFLCELPLIFKVESLRRRCPALFNRKRVLLQQGNARPTYCTNNHDKKFRNWEESNFYHTQHTALILRLQITISFDPWPISCVEQISKTLKLWKWVSPNYSHKETIVKGIPIIGHEGPRGMWIHSHGTRKR